MVFLCTETRKGSTRREAIENHVFWLLEGHGFAYVRLLIWRQGDWSEEDDGVLPWEVVYKQEDEVENERVSGNQRRTRFHKYMFYSEGTLLGHGDFWFWLVWFDRFDFESTNNTLQ